MMNQVASQTEIGKICSKQSPCSASRLSRPADTPSTALSHGQDPYLPSVGPAHRGATSASPVHVTSAATGYRLVLLSCDGGLE